jgi:hypothetical protein
LGRTHIGVALLPLVSAIAAEPVVSIDRGAAYDLTYSATCQCWSARVFVTRAKGFEKRPVIASIAGVAIGAQSTGELALQNPVPVNVSNDLAAFDLSTAKNTMPPHAVYDTILIFQSGATLQRQTIQLTVPAAVLRQPPALIISRWVPFLWFSEPNSTPALVLAPTEKSRAPAAVAISNQDLFADTDRQYGGQLRFTNSPNVPSDKQNSYPYTLEGDFPVGVVKANLLVTSRQLESPLTVPVEVHTRRVKAVLWCLILSGLVLGFLLRTLLKQQVQYSDLKQQGIDTLQDLDAAYRKAKDTTFKNRVKAAFDALQQSVEQVSRRNQNVLTDRINEARKALADATADLQQRIATAKAALDDFTKLVATPWRASEAISHALRNASVQLSAVDRALIDDNPALATGLLNPQVESLARFLLAETPRWQGTYGDVLTHLEIAGSLMIDPERSVVLSRIHDLQEALRKMPALRPDSQASDYLAALRTIDELTAAAMALMTSAASAIKHARSAIDSALENAPQASRSAWSNTEAPTNVYSDLLTRSAMRLTGDMRVQIERPGRDLHARWTAALLIQASEDKRDEVRELLNKGAWLEGVHRIFEAPKIATDDEIQGSIRHKHKTGRNVSPLAVAARTALSAFRAEDLEIEAIREIESSTPENSPQLASGATFRKLRHATFFEMLATKIFQWLISAIGLAIVGYMLFSDKFAGTSTELVTAFFWGFTTDVGLDALVSAAKPKGAG